MTTPLLAVAQLTSTHDIDANFHTCAQLVTQAKKAHASMVALPENFAFMPEHDGESLAIAEHLDGPLISRYLQLAVQHKIWLSLGGFPELSPIAGKIFNSHLLVDPTGHIVAVYRKIHLFALHVENGPQHEESNTVLAGERIINQATPVGRVGLSICFDLRFPSLYNTLAQQGAEVMLVPAAFTDYTGKAHWEVLLRARAIENQCYVAAAAQYGVHNGKRTTHGRSMIIDPWGHIIAECPVGTGIAVAPIDVLRVHHIRRQMPVVSAL